MATAETDVKHRPRPLSPHLQIYRPIVTMVMSIMHRVTGIINVGGLLLVTGFLLAISAGPESYAWGASVYGSWWARIILVAFTWSLIHHLLGGLRHLVWDMGKGFGDVRYTFAWLNLTLSVLLTTVLWAVIVVLEVE